MIIYIFILLLSVIISSLSQIFLKKSATTTHKNFISEYFNFQVIFSYIIFFIAIMLDVIALKKVPVSFIPVIESSSYIFIILFSRFFLNEKFTKRKILSIFIIFTGIIFFILN